MNSQEDLHHATATPSSAASPPRIRPTTSPPTPARSPPTVSGGGFGVRLDGGNAGAGTAISPYYDSLLVKVTSWDNTFEGVCRKAMRAISEVHIRGVKTNIPFVTNILHHPTFHRRSVPHQVHRRDARAV